MMSMNSDSSPTNEHRYWPFSRNRSAIVFPACTSTSLSRGSRVTWYQR